MYIFLSFTVLCDNIYHICLIVFSIILLFIYSLEKISFKKEENVYKQFVY